MNNPDTTHAVPERTDELPVHASSAEPILLPTASGPAHRSGHDEYSDSTNGIPQAARNRSNEDASVSLEVAAARLGASAFACGLLPAFLWSTGCLGAAAALSFAAVSAVGAVRFLLADPSLRTAGFVGAQMFVCGVAVALKFGLIAGATFGFLVLPAGLLTTATIFGRFRQAAPVNAGGDAQAIAPVLSTEVTRTRPTLRVVSGHSRPHSA